MREPTQAEAAAFTAHMASHFHAKVIDKDDSTEMQLVADFLSVLKIIDHDAFLNHYATTIGDRIWIPDAWTPWQTMSVLPHELHHVVQFRRDGGAAFSWAYITDQEQRSLLEAEAYYVTSEMNFWRFGAPVDPQWVVESLANYAIDEAHREVIRTYMISANITVSQGGVSHATSLEAIRWLEQHCPDIKA